MNSIIPPTVLTAARIVLPFKYTHWLYCNVLVVVFDKTVSNLIPMGFDPILTSKLINEIGLQLVKYQLSSSFFSIKVR